MGCTCETLKNDGKATVDHIRNKGKANDILDTPHTFKCECGEDFTMTKVVDNCPNCHMTYALPPCGQDDDNIRAAGINY